MKLSTGEVITYDNEVQFMGFDIEGREKIVSEIKLLKQETLRLI